MFALGLISMPLAAVTLPDTKRLSFDVFGTPLGPDGDLHALDDGIWLTSGMQGLAVLNGDALTILQPGQFESLDVRAEVVVAGQSGYLAAAIDKSSGHVILVFLSGKGWRVETVREVGFLEAVPEAICLYRDPVSAHVSLFSLDARGILEQRYVYDSDTGSLIDLPVRREIGVLGAEACAVHDPSRSLFVADEAFGVRRFDASEESDAVPEPWVLPHPWGPLKGEIEDMAIDKAGSLWLLVPDTGLAYRRDPAGSISAWSLPGATTPAVIATRLDGSTLSIALVDEENGSLYGASVQEPGKVRMPGDASTVAVAAKDTVTASAQTAPVRRYGDAADDPAIVVASSATEQPLILGTDKREGLALY
ncbi:MAG: phytase, partial [Halieaceae bacterium]|nr:phytase [Halieaceae bacterium]